MRAVRSVNGKATLAEVAEPAGDWPVLEVASASICGSDLGLLELGLPATLGHEFAGTLDGKPYCVEPVVCCGDCDQCRGGNTQRCRGEGRHGLLGVFFDGGLADRVAVPPAALIPLPSGLAVADASLVEPLAVCWHAFRRVSATAGERALVVGAGSVGLLAVAAARALGLEVDLVARHRHQRAAGERLGAGEPSGEYDIVIEAAGTQAALADCIAHAAPGGRIAVVGVNHGQWSVPGLPLLMNELTLVGSYCYSRTRTGHDFAEAAAALASNPDIAQTVVTHRFSLSEVERAFQVAADRSAGAIKVVLQP